MSKLLNVILVFLLFTACEQVPFGSSGESDTSFSSMDTTKITDSLRIGLHITSEEVDKLQDLKADFILKNISGQKLIYKFSSGCQVGYTIQKDQEVIFDVRNHRGCTQALTQFSLEPSQTEKFPISLKMYDGDINIGEGIYQLNAFLLDEHGVKISTSFEAE